MSFKFCKNLTLVTIHYYVQVIAKQSSTEISPALGHIWFNFTNGTAIQLDLYSGEVVQQTWITEYIKFLSPFHHNYF